MGVSYASDIYTQDRLFFFRLLFRWSGSVWQLLWLDYLIFVSIYVSLAALYQFALYHDPSMKTTFEVTVTWLKTIGTSVPLSFMLGFFVSAVVDRWWNVCMAMPWLYTPSFYCQALLDSPKSTRSDLARKLRITVLRYLNLAWILMMAGVSLHIKDRFGYKRVSLVRRKKKFKFKRTWRQRLQLINSDSKVQKYFGKMITENELAAFGRAAALSNDKKYTYDPEYWLPLVWATRLIRRARNLDCIADERQCLWLMQVVQTFRSNLQTVWMYSEFNLPLVYTQVCVTAVYIYLLSTILSTQLMDSDILQISSTSTSLLVNGTFQRSVDQQVLAFIPVIGGLEFIFYLGWFKTGISLLNPMGKDKADIPMSDILNSNLKAAVKMGGAEDSIFPLGLADSGEAEEDQVAEFLKHFDFSGVRAHDKFGSSEQTEQQLRKALLKRLQRRAGNAKRGNKSAAAASGTASAGGAAAGSGGTSGSNSGFATIGGSSERSSMRAGRGGNLLTAGSANSLTANSSLGSSLRSAAASIARARRPPSSERNSPVEEPVRVINFNRSGKSREI